MPRLMRSHKNFRHEFPDDCSYIQRICKKSMTSFACPYIFFHFCGKCCMANPCSKDEGHCDSVCEIRKQAASRGWRMSSIRFHRNGRLCSACRQTMDSNAEMNARLSEIPDWKEHCSGRGNRKPCNPRMEQSLQKPCRAGEAIERCRIRQQFVVDGTGDGDEL